MEKFIPERGTVVDIGCGYGIFAAHLAKVKSRIVIGIDLNGNRITLAREFFQGSSNLKFYSGDITKINLPKADMITAVDVIHHIPSEELQQKLISDCFRVLPFEGTLLIKDVELNPRWKYYWNKIHDYIITKGEPVLYQGREKIFSFLKLSGFEIINFYTIDGYPYAHVLYYARKPTISTSSSP